MTEPLKNLLPVLLSISVAGSSNLACLAEEILTQAPASGELNVAANHTVAIDFGQLGPQGLVLSGDITNFGTLFAFTSDPNVSVANFSAPNITNQAGALITSVMPAAGLNGLNINPAFLANNLSLSFNALNNFQNLGQITSAGNISITAGNTITNASSAVMSAMQNIDMTAINSIINSGVITAQAGNLNTVTAALNNQNGILQSLSGAVNIRSVAEQSLLIENTLGQINAATNVSLVNDLLQSTNESLLQGISLTGGTVTGTNIIFVSPTNNVVINADSLNGTVNLDSATAISPLTVAAFTFNIRMP